MACAGDHDHQQRTLRRCSNREQVLNTTAWRRRLHHHGSAGKSVSVGPCVGGIFRLISTGILPDPNDTVGYSSADRVWSGLSEAHRSSATGVQQMVVLWQRVLSYHDHAVQDVDLAAQQAHLRPSKFPARLLGHASDQWVLGNRELSRDPAGVPYVYI